MSRAQRQKQHQSILYRAFVALAWYVSTARPASACGDHFGESTSKNGLDHLQDFLNLVSTAVFGRPLFQDQWLLLYFCLIHLVAVNIFLLAGSRALSRTVSSVNKQVQDASEFLVKGFTQN